MSLYADILEDIRCPKCGYVGLVPAGDFDYECSACGYDGTLEEDYNRDE